MNVHRLKRYWIPSHLTWWPNGGYTGIIPLEAPESTGEAAMVAQFDEDVVQGRSIIVDEEEDGTINPVFCKDEITGTYAECVRIWLA